MKQFLAILSLAVVLCSCKTEPKLTDTYEITGTVKGMPNGIRVFIKSTENPRRPAVIDTAIIKNETFFFSGKTDGPVSRTLSVNSVNGAMPFILENGRIKINIDKNNIKNSSIDGSPSTSLLNKYIDQKKALSQQQVALNNAYRKTSPLKDKEAHEAAKKALDDQTLKVKNYTFDFIEANPDSNISLMSLENELKRNDTSIEKLESALTTLKNVISRNPSNQQIANKVTAYITKRKATANLEIGKKAPEFSAPDTEGNQKALKDMLGKVTIVDFWASWCGPCRRENPNVVKVYEKYHDKGLEIVGVSLDRKGQKQRWLDAIKKDKLTWNHVSNLNYFKDPVAQMYAVNSIPRTFILDENGTIIAKNLRGKALEDKIAELLN